MPQQSEIIEARIRLRIDKHARPHLHALFNSVDNSRYSTLVSLMLERCITYDKAFVAQGAFMQTAPQIPFPTTTTEPITGDASLNGLVGQKDAAPVVSISQRSGESKPAAPAAKPQPVKALVETASIEENAVAATVHDPADMAMALGGLGL